MFSCFQISYVYKTNAKIRTFTKRYCTLTPCGIVWDSLTLPSLILLFDSYLVYVLSYSFLPRRAYLLYMWQQAMVRSRLSVRCWWKYREPSKVSRRELRTAYPAQTWVVCDDSSWELNQLVLFLELNFHFFSVRWEVNWHNVCLSVLVVEETESQEIGTVSDLFIHMV